jgi:L-malate glycosyltransferase
MRILYMIDEMEALTAGGTERQVLQMIQLMHQAGADVQLCTLRGTTWLTAPVAGCKVQHFHLHSFWSVSGLQELRRLFQWLRDEKFDVLQTFFVEANIVGPVLGHFASIPVILGSRRNLNYWMGWGTATLQRFANRFCTLLVANCEAVKRHVVETESVDAEKVTVIYNGIDLSPFASDRPERVRLRSSWSIPTSAFVIGMVSALRPVKGVEHFVKAAIILTERLPDLRFIVIGDGPLRPALEDSVQLHRLQSVFLFLGSQENVALHLQMMDVAVLSSDSEGFSNSILEYLAAGLAVVATDVGGNAEATGPAGILVPPRNPRALADAIETVAADSSARLRFRMLATAHVKNFSLERAKSQLYQLYSDLLE